MPQEALVILVYLVADQRLLPHDAGVDRMFEAFDNHLKYRLVEHKPTAVHDAGHVGPGQQFAALQYDTVATGVEGVNPELLVQYLPREYQDFNLRILDLCLPADVDAHHRRAAEAEVEEHKVGLLLPYQFPIITFVTCRAYNLSLGYVAAQYALGALQLQRDILYYYNLEVLHISLCLLLLFSS